MKRYVFNRTDKTEATIGYDHTQKTIYIENKEVVINFIETWGEELRTKSFQASFYRRSDCCILVFDITNENSFLNLKLWRDDFMLKRQPEFPDFFPFAVIGNKLDHNDQRKVSEKRAKKFCAELIDNSFSTVPYFETSATANINVSESFNKIMRSVINTKLEEGEADEETVRVTSNENPIESKKSKKCCN